jgi:phosphate transport system substrate-binding protein
MKRAWVFLLVGFLYSVSAGNAHGAERIQVAGSGGMIPLVTALAKAYMAENKNAVILVNQKSIQSGGGIKGAASGELGIGMANRALKDEEKSLGLETVEIARVGVVIGVNRRVTIRSISSGDLCNIYSGKTTNWGDIGGSNEKIIALTKPETDATKETVRNSIACFKGLKEAEGIVVIPTSPETTQALIASKAVGFTSTVDVEASKGNIVTLNLDGIAPTPDNVASGRYKVVQAYRLVTKGKPAGAIKEFIDFVRGPKGVKVIESTGAVPAK